MERSRSHKSSKPTSKNGGSKRSSKSREPSEKKSSKRKATEKAASDSDDDAQLSEEDRPSVKPVKTVKKPRIASKSDEDDTSSEDAGTKLQMNSEGERYLDLGKKKRVTVRSFKGMTLVDIREYYGTDGDEKPGKKGISLTVEQWESLMQGSSAISDLL